MANRALNGTTQPTDFSYNENSRTLDVSSYISRQEANSTVNN
jgi:hypothetical protein